MDIAHDNLVEQFRASGLTQRTFCIGKNIKQTHLRYLLYKKNKTPNQSAAPAQGSLPALIRLDEQTISTYLSAVDTSRGAAVPSFTVVSRLDNERV
jgi:hypothetical protein